MLPHTPGRACAPGGIFSQRSGLSKHTQGSISSGPVVTEYTVGWEGIEGGLRLLEFLSVLSPYAFISVQGKNRDKHPIPLGDPD
jgi:hypothetical protein